MYNETMTIPTAVRVETVQMSLRVRLMGMYDVASCCGPGSVHIGQVIHVVDIHI